jgi:hypothetical protein
VPRFGVRVEGSNCVILVRRRFRSQTVRQGFFATRFVDADEEKSAADLVVASINAELRNVVQNALDDPWSMTIDEIWRAADSEENVTGFTWFRE